jgi:hypothetical protein
VQCFAWLLLIGVGVFVMVSLLRWFEQTAEAVERREWNRVALLVAVPFSVWFFPSKVSAGRPTAVPRHEPVRGFGTVPKEKAPVADAKPQAAGATAAPQKLSGLTDEAPPGTPKEFLGMPVVPPKSKAPKAPVDPDKLAKLRRKMMEQGMLKEEPQDEQPPPSPPA